MLEPMKFCLQFGQHTGKSLYLGSIPPKRLNLVDNSQWHVGEPMFPLDLCRFSAQNFWSVIDADHSEVT
jgi:hypothetical protein